MLPGKQRTVVEGGLSILEDSRSWFWNRHEGRVGVCKERAFPISFQGTDMNKSQTEKSHYCNHGAGVMAKSSKNTWLNVCQRSKLLVRQLYGSKTPSSGLSPNGSP